MSEFSGGEMINLLEQQVSKFKTREEKINQLREFLQVLVLKIIFDLGYFKNLSFVGGTALRIIYDLRRFSEDLDFSLISENNYDFINFLELLEKQLKNYAVEVDINYKDKKAVQNIDLKFKNLLSSLNLSSNKKEKLYIKVEIDSNPPAGANSEISLINKTYLFSVAHYDLASLYATKIHACFYRKYTKGRDFYDLIWYLGKKIKPNYTLLNNAIYQTEGKTELVNEANFGWFLKDKLSKVNFEDAKKDVERFLEDKQELKLLDKDIILKLSMT